MTTDLHKAKEVLGRCPHNSVLKWVWLEWPGWGRTKNKHKAISHPSQKWMTRIWSFMWSVPNYARYCKQQNQPTTTVGFWIFRWPKWKWAIHEEVGLVGVVLSLSVTFISLITIMNNLALTTTWPLMCISCSWCFCIKYIEERTFTDGAFLKYL